jgi:hypothetical protein
MVPHTGPIPERRLRTFTCLYPCAQHICRPTAHTFAIGCSQPGTEVTINLFQPRSLT